MKTREQPCGRCNRGTYSIDTSMNVKARKFGALDEKERFESIPMCKIDKHLKCAGDTDFHFALIDLDKRIEENKRK